MKAFTIGAVFEIGMSEYDQTFVFMPISDAQMFFSTAQQPADSPQATAIDVFVDDPDGVGPLKDQITIAAERPTLVTDWRQRNVTFFSPSRWSGT